MTTERAKPVHVRMSPSKRKRPTHVDLLSKTTYAIGKVGMWAVWGRQQKLENTTAYPGSSNSVTHKRVTRRIQKSTSLVTWPVVEQVLYEMTAPTNPLIVGVSGFDDARNPLVATRSNPVANITGTSCNGEIEKQRVKR